MENKNHYVGLTDRQVEDSRVKYGTNVLTPPKEDPLWKQFLEKFQDPLIIILMAAGVLSICISCYEYFILGHKGTVFFEPIGIFVAILLATGLAFYFEQRSNKAFSLLNKVNDDEPIKVYRNGIVVEVPKKDIVVGDIVVLATGDEIPADGKLLESVMLQIDESTLTGEPICRKTIKESEFIKDATYPSNVVLKGTKVMEGHGVFVVEKVGDKTENGKILLAVSGVDIEKIDEKELMDEQKRANALRDKNKISDAVKTPLNEQLDGLGELITKLSYGFAALIIVGRLVHYFGYGEWLAWTLVVPTAIFFWLVIKKFEDWKKLACITTIVAFFVVFIGMVVGIHNILLPGEELSALLAHTLNTLMIAVTLIVVAVPEGLPMAVTLSLAYSMQSMLKTNNLVRKMHACETMGATTVICTDKTGTLTQNKMQVYQSNFYDLKGQQLNDSDISKRIAEGIAVNSTASLDLSKEEPVVIGNPTEGALLLWLHGQGEKYQDIKGQTECLLEIPFSTERKFMATVVRSADGKKLLYVKGAPEMVFGMCAKACGNVSEAEVNKQLAEYQRQAMRTLGFAYQELDENEKGIECGQIVAKNLTFLGIVAISDPVREDVPPAVKECMDAGIAVKIVTGDTPGTAMEIGRQIGLWKETDTDDNIIMGPDFAALSDQQLEDRVDDLKVIARARPMDKERLVKILQKKNHVVAVTGDGTNDAPALNAAHVGLSMGAGTSVAKEASDITIIDNSFSSIGRAVMWGRSLYQNIQRFLLFQLTVNVSACFIVLVGAFMGMESPLTVTQMLWVNLIMDTFGAMALASLPPSPSVMRDKPRDRNAFILSKSMYANVLGVGFAFFLMLLALLYICQHAEINNMMDFLHLSLGQANSVTPYEQTLIFSIFVWTHFWYMFNARAFATGKSVFSLKMSGGFVTIVGVIVLGQILIVELLHDFFNVEPMFFSSSHPEAWKDWLIIVLGSSIVLWIREVWRLVVHKNSIKLKSVIRN